MLIGTSMDALMCRPTAQRFTGRASYEGCAYPQIHGEQCLVANALLHGERGLRKLAVSAAPCGHCRQFYSELCCAVRACAVCRSILSAEAGNGGNVQQNVTVPACNPPN